jgi:hypothetical protein
MAELVEEFAAEEKAESALSESLERWERFHRATRELPRVKR